MSEIKRAAFDAIAIGAAGEHMVCADLILQGHRASIAAAQLPYDIVLDVSGRLLRVAVKATRFPKARAGRMGSRPCYLFSITRTKSPVKRYTAAHTDLIALVALDIRRVAYFAITEAVTIQHIDSPEHATGTNKYGPKGVRRRQFDDLPLARALEVLRK